VIKWDEALKSTIKLGPDVLAWDAKPKLLPDAEGFYPVAMPGQNTNLYI
jgi:hypothetical protein